MTLCDDKKILNVFINKCPTTSYSCGHCAFIGIGRIMSLLSFSLPPHVCVEVFILYFSSPYNFSLDACETHARTCDHGPPLAAGELEGWRGGWGQGGCLLDLLSLVR